MELRIDYYSKTEVAIQLDFSGRYPFTENEHSELFLFASYAIRQLSNLGSHDVGKVLGLLLSTFRKDTAIELAEGRYKFPGPTGMGFMGFERLRLHMPYNIIQDQLFQPVPKLVTHRGNGKKSFSLETPPSKLSTKGFGILGFNINFFAFHSVFAFFTFLAKKQRSEEDYLEHLSAVAQKCGNAYLSGKISMGDQIPLVNSILKEVGVS